MPPGSVKLSGETVLITGGAGFIGSHLAERLVSLASRVVVFDNLSTGSVNNIKHLLDRSNFTFVKGDLLDREAITKAVSDISIVFHLAANPEVRVGYQDTRVDLEQNVLATYNLLEAMRLGGKAKLIAFTSTSTVYGEAGVLPTPEDYGPLIPISLYGASKLACEALIAAYCHLFAFKAIIYRLANVVGPRSAHGVLHDFVEKLRSNPEELEILGDGKQRKSYLHVSDCIEAMLFCLERAEGGVEVFNVGSDDAVEVKTIAEIVVEEMGLKDVKFKFKGGPGGRGWPGDVKEMLLDIGKLKRLGWRPKHGGEEAIRMAVREFLRGLT